MISLGKIVLMMFILVGCNSASEVTMRDNSSGNEEKVGNSYSSNPDVADKVSANADLVSCSNSEHAPGCFRCNT